MIARPRLRNMRLAWAVFAAQIMTGIVMAILFGWLAGAESASAAFFGAVVASVPALWMAWWLLPRRRQVDASRRTRAFFWGELGKLGLTIGLFIAAALFFGQHYVALLCSYTACLTWYGFALILTR